MKRYIFLLCVFIILGSLQAALIHQWTFNNTLEDSVGNADLTLINGAQLVNGSLVVNGNSQYATTATLHETVGARTLMVWVSLATLSQGAGGVISLDKSYTDAGAYTHTNFDSIVFSENYAQKWQAGSEYGTRNYDVGGPVETLTSEVCIAISYAADNSITIYRNGAIYGSSYTKASLITYQNDFRVLFGYRHMNAGSGFINASINEGRIYNTSLTASEIQSIYNTGTVPEPSTALLFALVLGFFFYSRKK